MTCSVGQERNTPFRSGALSASVVAFFATLGSGLMAGLFFAFSVFVMRALGASSGETGDCGDAGSRRLFPRIVGADVPEIAAAKGATVALAARRLDQLKQIVAEIRAAGGKASAHQTDVTDKDQVAKRSPHGHSAAVPCPDGLCR